MNYKRLAGITILLLILFTGCSGANGNLKNQSESVSKATQQELINNWSDYDISYNITVLVFDPRNDDKKILFADYCCTVEDQEAWTQIINGTKTIPHGWRTNQVWGNPIREIWFNNQFYGYISHEQRELIRAQIVDENTVRIFHHNSGDWRL